MLQNAFLYIVHCLNRDNTVSVRIREIGFSLFAGISTCTGRSKSSLISVFRCLFPWRFQNMFNADIWFFSGVQLTLFPSISISLHFVLFWPMGNRQLFTTRNDYIILWKFLLTTETHAPCTCPPDGINQWSVSPIHVIIDSDGINKGIWLVVPICGITFW